MSSKIFGKRLAFAKPFHDLSGELQQPGQYRLANVSFGRIAYIELAPPLRLASTQGRVSFFLPLTKLATILGQPAIANLKVAALPRGILKRTVTEMFKRFAPRVKIDPEADFDKVFTVLAHRALNPYKRFFSRDDYDDIILDTLLAVLNKKTIEAYDPSQNVVSYLGGMFQMRLKNVIRDRLARSKYEHEIPNLTDGQSVDEYLENIDSREQDGDAVNELEFKQLMSKLQAFLSKQPEAKYYIPMLDLMLKGYSNREIANELNVSPTIISRYFGRLKDVIYRFAKGVNPELADAMEKMLGQNRAAAPVYQHYNPADPYGFEHQVQVSDDLYPYVENNDRFLHRDERDTAPTDLTDPAIKTQLIEQSERLRDNLLSSILLIRDTLDDFLTDYAVRPTAKARSAATIERHRVQDPLDPAFRSTILSDPNYGESFESLEQAFQQLLNNADEIIESSGSVVTLTYNE